MTAYMLVQTDAATHSIAGDLQTVSGVVFAHDLHGPYDAIALARSAPEGPALEQIVAEIRELPGVTRALTAPMVVRSPVEKQSSEAA